VGPPRLRVGPGAPDPETLARAARVLRAGGVVAYPTEHLYALACDPLNPEAVAALFTLKGRDADKAVLLGIADRSDLSPWVARVPEAARDLVAAWPEGLTLVFEAAPGVPTALTAGGPTIGLRLIRTPLAAALIRACGGALPATSANPSGAPPSGDPDDVAAGLPGLDLLLDAGPLSPGGLSTLLDVTRTPWRILRPGTVARSAIAAFGPVAPDPGTS